MWWADVALLCKLSTLNCHWTYQQLDLFAHCFHFIAHLNVTDLNYIRNDVSQWNWNSRSRRLSLYERIAPRSPTISRKKILFRYEHRTLYFSQYVRRTWIPAKARSERNKNCKFVCGIHLAISHRIAHPRSGKSLKSISFMNISYTFANDLAIRCRRSARWTLLIEYRRRRRTRKNNLYIFGIQMNGNDW